MRARIGSVDQEVVESGVPGPRCDRALEPLGDVADLPRGLPGFPVPPVAARRDHHGLGIQHQDIGIVGVGIGEGAHPRRIDDVERMRLRRAARRADRHVGHGRLGGPGLGTVALAQGFDQGLFARRGGGDARGRPGQVATRIDEIAAIRVVDVGTGRLGHAPGAHRAVRIQRQGRLEGARRLDVVERIRLQHAAGVKLPRRGNGAGDRQLEAAEALERWRARVAVGREQGRARAQAEQGGRGGEGTEGERRAANVRLSAGGRPL